MQSSPRARASPSVSGLTPSSLNDLFIPPSPVPDRSRKSARLASQDAGSVRTFLAARGVEPAEMSGSGSGPGSDYDEGELVEPCEQEAQSGGAAEHGW
uniref:Uncharacterized protein n=1 Tax=Knipowitschia caucasica TaxID=637954 RepID=A0AAV2J4H6_KNICA